MAGRFITLEGGEGVGKSTQAARLSEALRQRGLEVVQTREPGGSAGAEAIRALLMTGDADRWGAGAEALLFAAARADHVTRTIRPALARGAWVVCDRYLDSSRAYQGGADGIADADLLTLHRVGSGGLLPDRTLLLEMAQDEGGLRAMARDGGVADRFGERANGYHDRVSASFDVLADAEPHRFRRVDARGTPDEVTGRLLAALADLL